MPPFVPRKRSFSESPAPTPSSKRFKPTPSVKAKQTLFSAADASSRKRKSAEETEALLNGLSDGAEDETSLSEIDSDDFEDVEPAKPINGHESRKRTYDEDEDDQEEEMDWEDAIPESASTVPRLSEHEIGDVSISINEDGSYVQPLVSNSSSNNKKGPSKRERQIRIQTHCLHVTTLLWHNVVRNSWLNDSQVQKLLMDGLPDGVKREITRWREAMGMLTKEELEEKKKRIAAKNKAKGRRKTKGKATGGGRDWSYVAEHLEQGVPDLSRGDPLLRLLKVLAAYWRKRFVVTAPALRKQGYMTLARLRNEMKDWDKDRNDDESHGERIENIHAFRGLAKRCEGSRDVGAQLFVALLRAIGLQTRMVANLQPAGFGWSKGEEANDKRPKKSTQSNSDPVKDSSKDDEKMVKRGKKPAQTGKAQPTRKPTRGNKADPIDLDDSDDSLSSPPSEMDENIAEEGDDDDDLSVVDITPTTPKRPSKKYDRELAFPTYWTEVCSPVSNKYIPVDPIVLSTIASNEELLQTFEPRGQKADKMKQVICYTVAFSADGSAKDVTIRYLKRHQLPGKTKGVRMPVEKVPVYDKRGKVKKHEDFDWFRTTISKFDRPESKRNAADELEEQTDLKPFKPAKEDKPLEKESLQWYKQSAEFVLEQHLRREEALVPGAESVRTFLAGKGDKAKECPVYRRDDVVNCKTVESWHKEGRAIKIGEQPIKYVPVRAVTLIRKREIEDAERETGEKLKQGLYSIDQTDWIIPPPIKDGVIPKNAFGNMDVYVPTMVPKGAIHLPLKGTAKLCRKLQIDYAEACTGFEFGKQRAVPVITGVVVAKEHAQMVKDAWRAEQAEIKRKEDTKRTGVSLHWWRKMLMGLRIVERMREEYAQSGGNEEEINPFVNKAKREGRVVEVDLLSHDGDMEGGFLPPGHTDDKSSIKAREIKNEGADGESDSDGFLLDAEDDVGGGFLIEEHSNHDQDLRQPAVKRDASSIPVSLQSIHRVKGENSDDEAVKPDEDSDLSESPKSGNFSNTTKATRKTATKDKAVVMIPPPSDDEARDVAQSNGLSSDSDSSGEDNPESLLPPPERKRMTGKARSKRSNKPVQTTQKTRQSKTKSTPVKSQYFDHDDDSDDDVSDDGEESTVEVVKPRRTTARTRSKR